MAAVVAGLINSLAGGGGLITFPLLALVVPPVVADATSALALLPAYPGAVWRTRDTLQEVRRLWLWLLLVTSALGGLVGALLLVWTGDRNFTFLVPWLVFGGAVATCGGCRVRSGHLRRILRGRYRHLDDQCPELAADGRRPPRRALQESARRVPQGRGCGRASDLRRDRLGLRNSYGLRGPHGRLPWGRAYRQGKPHHPPRDRRGYRDRAGGVLLLDTLRPIGTTRHRRLGTTGFREASYPPTYTAGHQSNTHRWRYEDVQTNRGRDRKGQGPHRQL